MDGPEACDTESGGGGPSTLDGAWSGVHVSSTSKPPANPVLSTVNRPTNGAKLVASCAMVMALPYKAPRPIRVAQFGVRPGSGGGCGPARYAEQSSDERIN